MPQERAGRSLPCNSIVLAFLRSTVRLVLSAAVLVIDLSIILRIRLGDTSEFYHGPNMLVARESIALLEL